MSSMRVGNRLHEISHCGEDYISGVEVALLRVDVLR